MMQEQMERVRQHLFRVAEEQGGTAADELKALERELSSSQRALRLQRSVGLALNGAADTREATEEFFTAMGAALDFTAAGVWKPGTGGDALELCLSWTAPGATFPYREERVLKGAGGLVGRVWRTGAPAWAADISGGRQAGERCPAAALCIPVKVGDRLLAVIELLGDRPFEPDEDLLASLDGAAGQMGLFMERVGMEHRLQEREREFRALVENSPDPIARYDRDLRCVYVNSAVERLGGVSREQLIGGRMEEHFPYPEVARWRRKVKRALETGKPQSMEIAYTGPKGTHVFDNRIVPEFNDAGSVVSVLNIGRDVTEMKRTEQEAQARYEQLRALVQAAPIGMIVADVRTSTVVLANREYERLINCARRPGDWIGAGQLNIVPRKPDGTPFPPEEMPLMRALTRGEFIQAEELLIEHPDGSVFSVIATAAPVLDGDGEAVAAISVLQDVTRLRELDRLRSDFLGMVGHELRTPLAIIRLAITSLMAAPDHVSAEELQETLGTVDDQASRMAGIISNLRDVAQIQAGAFSVYLEPGDLREVLRQAKDDMVRTGVENIELKTPRFLPLVPMDRTRILQVLENLLSNAGKYGAPSRPIVVEVEPGPDQVTVHVRNEGPGIPANRQAQLFHKFSRLDRTKRPGSGLGLAIAKGIVQAHGGSISVESSAGAPITTFSFTLPLEAPATSPGRSKSSGSASGDQSHQSHQGIGGKKRVLAVDDEPVILRHVKRVLERAGYEVITTTDGKMVEDSMEREHPDLVLLDVVLSDMNGFDLFERIRPTGVPVVFISGAGLEEDRWKARAMGAKGFLVKPVHTDDLVATVTQALETRSAAG